MEFIVTLVVIIVMLAVIEFYDFEFFPARSNNKGLDLKSFRDKLDAFQVRLDALDKVHSQTLAENKQDTLAVRNMLMHDRTVLLEVDTRVAGLVEEFAELVEELGGLDD